MTGRQSEEGSRASLGGLTDRSDRSAWGVGSLLTWGPVTENEGIVAGTSPDTGGGPLRQKPSALTARSQCSNVDLKGILRGQAPWYPEVALAHNCSKHTYPGRVTEEGTQN